MCKKYINPSLEAYSLCPTQDSSCFNLKLVIFQDRSKPDVPQLNTHNATPEYPLTTASALLRFSVSPLVFSWGSPLISLVQNHSILQYLASIAFKTELKGSSGSLIKPGQIPVSTAPC